MLFATAVLALSLFLAGCDASDAATEADEAASSYDDLVALFHEWREFAAPEVVNGVPDYSKRAMAKQHEEFANYLSRLNGFDTGSWSLAQQIDLEVVRAEMNALDFNHRVLRSWERDPAFYKMIYPRQSDTPAREGPVIYTAIDTWKYNYPLSEADAAELAERFNSIAPLYEVARENLTGNTADLFIGGIHTIRQQVGLLVRFRDGLDNADVQSAVDNAIVATQSFLGWLEEEAPGRTGPSGVGKENYNWYLKHVQLVPYTWQDEVTLMERELGRAHAYLRIEENRNRNLTQLERISSAAEYDKALDEVVTEFFDFLRDEEILTVEPWMEPEMREHNGTFVPVPEGQMRSFFAEVTYRDPMPLRTHFYHWLEIARIENDPLDSPIRRSPHLYNIFAGRSEGMATSFEEMMLAAGMFESRPRARELIYIMLAQRAARALGGLYMHGNELDMEGASLFAAEWTPRGWMPKESDLMKFEQHLYLRQPFYGTSYVTGKIEMDKLIKDVSKQWGDAFTLKRFHDELNRKGVVPVSLVRWEMTGDGAEVAEILGD